MPPNDRRANLWDLVVVDWVDAYFRQDPMDLAAVADLPACLRRTVGYLVRDDKEYVGIACSDDRGAAVVLDTYELQELNMIPQGCIKRFTRLMGKGGNRDTDLLS